MSITFSVRKKVDSKIKDSSGPLVAIGRGVCVGARVGVGWMVKDGIGDGGFNKDDSRVGLGKIKSPSLRSDNAKDKIAKTGSVRNCV